MLKFLDDKLSAASLWSGLAVFGNNIIVKRMYIWLLVTPVAVKILHATNEWLVITSENSDFNAIVLPFSWYRFFFAALFFTIANIVFSARSPKIIKNYRNYGEFEMTKFSPERIWEFTKDLSSKNKKAFLDKHYLEEPREILYIPSNDNLQLSWEGQNHIVSPRELYNDIMTAADVDFVFWRYFVLVSYALGLALFAWVLLENVLFVLKEFWFS